MADLTPDDDMDTQEFAAIVLEIRLGAQQAKAKLSLAECQIEDILRNEGAQCDECLLQRGVISMRPPRNSCPASSPCKYRWPILTVNK